ncbi:hypothetical protein ACOMHN_041721 [Nucella lapillus]
MASSFITQLNNPELVARFQKWCGVEFVAEEDNSDAEERFSAGYGPAVSRNDHCPADQAATGHAMLDHGKTNNNNNNGSKQLTCSSNGVSHVNCQDFDHHHGNGTVKSFGSGNLSSTHEQRCHAWKRESDRRKASSNCQTNQAAQKTATRVSVRYPVLYYWAQVGAFLGNEEFYLTGLPYLMWTVDSSLVRQTIVVWWLVMYLGQAGKDYFAWPRPACPPVVRLETTHLAEYSLPSTHAMAGTAIPLLMSKLLLQRYQLPTVPVVCLAVLWCFTTCLSRLYLGVHTVLDILSGFLVSLVLYILVSPLTSGYDLYQQTHPIAPLVLILPSLALCTILYPTGPGKTSAKGDAITTTSVVVGLGVGVWLNYQLGFSHMVPAPVRLPVTPPSLSWLAMSLLQFVVGVAVVYAVKVVMKRLTVRFFSFFFGLDRLDAQHPGVMVGATYTTYLCLGLVIAFFDPLLFTVLGFGRPGYYMEML